MLLCAPPCPVYVGPFFRSSLARVDRPLGFFPPWPNTVPCPLTPLLAPEAGLGPAQISASRRAISLAAIRVVSAPRGVKVPAFLMVRMLEEGMDRNLVKAPKGLGETKRVGKREGVMNVQQQTREMIWEIFPPRPSDNRKSWFSYVAGKLHWNRRRVVSLFRQEATANVYEWEELKTLREGALLRRERLNDLAIGIATVRADTRGTVVGSHPASRASAEVGSRGADSAGGSGSGFQEDWSPSAPV